MPISRRDILKSLTITAVTGSVLRVIPLEAAEYAHRMVRAEKAAAENGLVLGEGYPFPLKKLLRCK